MKRTYLLILMVAVGLFVGCGSDTSKSKGKTPNNTGGTCGNGALDPGEVCDPSIESGEGACPNSCSAPACSTAVLDGDANTCTARCIVEPIACANGDGCCPTGCDSTTDSDCTNTCGDGVVEGPESCDGDCPATCPSPEACTEGVVKGSADTCSVRCDFVPIQLCDDGDGCCLPGCTVDDDSDCSQVVGDCGNGTIDEGETCDGDCPTSCASPNACVGATLVGTADSCDARCETTPVQVCQGGDGCCPAACTPSNDSDCSGACGNGQLDGMETCDGNCPTSCNDNVACTTDTLIGSADNCNVQCIYDTVTVCQGGDGCCPANCSSQNDSDCNCTPRTCASQGFECGQANDGCGQALDCGVCPSGEGCTANNICDAAAGIGAPCTTNTDCGVGLQTCELGAPGGYCTVLCIPGSVTCPAGSTCTISAIGQTPIACTKNCTSDNDCRPGYACLPDLFNMAATTCVPSGS